MIELHVVEKNLRNYLPEYLHFSKIMLRSQKVQGQEQIESDHIITCMRKQHRII